MSTPPIHDVDLDLLTPGEVVDLAPALIDYLRRIHTRQHAMMSAWGGCAMVQGVDYTASGSTTWTHTIRVPPGVTECDLCFTVYGGAIMSITTTNDATGTQLRCVEVGGSSGAQTPTKVATGGLIAASAGAASGRAVTVRSSVAWTWADVDLTIALTDVDGFGCLAVETRPIHVPR